jgi:ankyrin repeat protein
MESLNELLIYAVEDDDFSKVKELLDKGANPNFHNTESLVIASENNNFKIAKLLIEKKANIHTHNDYPIITFAENNNFNAVKFFIESGCKPDLHDNILLTIFASFGNFNAVNELIEDFHVYHDTFKKQKSAYLHNSKTSPFLEAVLNNKTKVAIFLFEKGVHNEEIEIAIDYAEDNFNEKLKSIFIEKQKEIKKEINEKRVRKEPTLKH